MVKLRMNEARSETAFTKRNGHRQRTLLSGKIVCYAGRRSFDCAVRDLSVSGARVRISPGLFFEDNCSLVIPHRRIVHKTLVAWRRSNEVGLKIIESRPLEDTSDPYLNYLLRETARTLH